MVSYYSHAKLLLSGEYLVLKGSSGLALPLRKGQSLILNPVEHAGSMSWEATYNKNTWFTLTFDPDTFQIIATSDKSIAGSLIKILETLSKMEPGFKDQLMKNHVRTEMDFNPKWGLGSSSTLISNLAYWAGTDPYELFFSVSKGSAYDIACARADHAILYKLEHGIPQISNAFFAPKFSDHIYFAYTGRKQLSSSSVDYFLDKARVTDNLVDEISAISICMADSGDLDDFEACMTEHENIIGDVLNKPSYARQLLPDYPYALKSLGAWGGDFIMLSWKDSRCDFKKYLKQHGIDVFFTYDELVLQEGVKNG